MNNKKYTRQLTEVVKQSQNMARKMQCHYILPEHLLLAMLEQDCDFTHKIMEKMAVNPATLSQSLNSVIMDGIKQSATDDLSADNNDNEPLFDSKASSILRLADLEARMSRDQNVDVRHLILAILHDGISSSAKDILHKHNVNYDDVLTFSQNYKTTAPANGIDLNNDDEEDDMLDAPEGSKAKTEEQKENGSREGRKTPILDNFTTDLTEAASEGKLDPMVGREIELQRVTEILLRRKKNNPVLIGEPGVGKSAIVEGLAQLIADNKTSPILHNKRIVALDLAGMVAGTKYRGQFEERIKGLIKELEDNPDVIIFIDEIHTIIGAGSAAGTMDAANMLKPALARGAVQCIGATTLDEYRKSIEKDGALERRFQKIIVNPTSVEETTQIIHNIKQRYEQHHHVSYTDEALDACVTLTARYITDRAFPDKAIDALDEVGARMHLHCGEIPPEITETEKQIEDLKAKKLHAVRGQNFELAASYRDSQITLEKKLNQLTEAWKAGECGNTQVITAEDVADVVSTMSGVPVQKIAETEAERLKTMGSKLKSCVIAQDQAIDKIVKAIQRNRVGLRDPNHPIGVFMFLGPTGVGKTYLAKKLAEHMFGSKDALIRIDMSEYTESFNASRLVGAPPGYVGYEEGGQLTERVRRKPYSIVLLDEIEKAHGNIYNMLLQVMDEGRLTDGNGRLIDFRNTIIIMTSNTGTRQLKEFGHGVGFNAGDGLSAKQTDKDKTYARSIIQKSLSKQFAPEFLNRLDEIITFDQLDQKAMLSIIDIELSGLCDRIKAMGYTLNVTDEAKRFVAEKGYDVQFGARPLKRAIQNYIEDKVCERLLDGSVAPGGEIVISEKDFEQQ